MGRGTRLTSVTPYPYIGVGTPYRGEYLDVDLICHNVIGTLSVTMYYGRVDQPTIAVDQPGLNRPTS